MNAGFAFGYRLPMTSLKVLSKSKWDCWLFDMLVPASLTHIQVQSPADANPASLSETMTVRQRPKGKAATMPTSILVRLFRLGTPPSLEIWPEKRACTPCRSRCSQRAAPGKANGYHPLPRSPAYDLGRHSPGRRRAPCIQSGVAQGMQMEPRVGRRRQIR